MILSGLAVFGASGHGRVVAELATEVGWKSIDFYDDTFLKKGRLDGHPIKGNLNDLLTQFRAYGGVHVAVGANEVRLRILKSLQDLNVKCPNIISPSAIISPTAELGTGIAVMANVVVNANASIGDGVILNTSCSVDHDCEISSGVHISPGARLAGDVSVGECSWIGIGSSIIQGIDIGANTTIGAGSVVIKSIPGNVVSVGVPSRVVR